MVEHSRVVIITGASRGFGCAVARAFARRQHRNSMVKLNLILTARSMDELQQVAHDLNVSSLRDQDSASPCIHVECTTYRLDFQDLDNLEQNLSLFFQNVVLPIVQNPHLALLPSLVQHVILINNHGSLGYLGNVTDCLSFSTIRRNLDLNITSALWVTLMFTKFMKSITGTLSSFLPKQFIATVVNVSSLVAIQPFPSMSIYSAGKASREAFHVALAKELPSLESKRIVSGCDGPIFKILNYAPGPMDTTMAKELAETESVDADIRTFYQNADNLVNPNDSAEVLVRLVLNEVPYESGDHIDYYDIIKDTNDNRK
jgi:sepiapterin reductase